MPAPKRSLRPRGRSDNKGMSPKETEGSTRSPHGIYVTDRDNADAASRGNNEARRRAEEGSPRDTPTYMNGGMVKQGYMGGGMIKKGYMDGGEVRQGDVRDNAKRGKTY